MAYASLDDVAVDYDGDVSSAEMVVKVQTLLERAEARIRQAYPDLDVRISDGRTNLVLVRQVESEMVAAVLRNPGGYTQQSTSNTEGPFAETRSGTLSTTLASGLLRLTKAHRRLLGDRVGGVFSLAPGTGHRPRPYGPVRSPEQFRDQQRREHGWDRWNRWGRED